MLFKKYRHNFFGISGFVLAIMSFEKKFFMEQGLMLTVIFVMIGALPARLIHNIFKFNLGGIRCKVFNMVPVVVSFIRFGKDGVKK